MASERRLQFAVAVGIMLVLAGSLFFGLRFIWRTEQLADQQMAFVAGISHEIRTPLAVIASASDNLADRVVTKPERIVAYGKLIRRETDRLRTMVENVLLYARLFSDHPANGDAVCCPGEVLESVLKDMAPVFQERNGTLHLDLEDGDLSILMEREALLAVLRNLLVNAVKYSDPGSKVYISACRKNQSGKGVFEIAIRDEGYGIAKDEQDKVFERFFRGKMAREAQIQGSGLGLSLASKLVWMHGGSIHLKSELGQGSTFWVRLPLATKQECGL